MEYTVKDIAELLNISKSTVQRAINTEGLSPDVEGKQKRLYGYEKTVRIIGILAPEFDISTLKTDAETESQTASPMQETASLHQKNRCTASETESPMQKPLHDAVETASPLHETDEPHQGDIKALEQALDDLRRELEETRNERKEETAFFRSQLMEKDKQITSLQSTLELAEQNLARAQSLHALDKQKLLELESKKEPEEPETGSEEPEETESSENQEQEPQKGWFSRFWSSLIN